MTNICLLPVLTLAFVQSVFAQMPNAEQLLPDDTIAVVTVPDWQKLQQQNEQSAWGKLWDDPAMKRFRDNFWTNFQEDFLQSLERETGVKLRENGDLLQGQVTLALTPPSEGSKDMFGFLLLIGRFRSISAVNSGWFSHCFEARCSIERSRS